MGDWVDAAALVESIELQREREYGYGKRPTCALWADNKFWDNMGNRGTK